MLSCIFFVLAFLVYSGGMNLCSEKPAGVVQILLSAALTLASMLCKEPGVTAVGVLAAFDIVRASGAQPLQLLGWVTFQTKVRRPSAGR